MRISKLGWAAAGAVAVAAAVGMWTFADRPHAPLNAAGDVAGEALAAAAALAGPIGVANAQEAADPLGEERIETLKSRGYLIGDVALGEESAPVTVIEYASLSCGHCRRFHATALPEIKEQYIEPGKAKLVVREVYFDRLGLYASAIARCSGRPAAFHAFIEVFLDKQGEWFFGTDDAAVAQGVQSLRRLGQLGGLSLDRIDACLTDGEFLEHLFASFQKHATEDSVRATPTLLIGDQRIRGAQAAAAVAEVIDAELDG